MLVGFLGWVTLYPLRRRAETPEGPVPPPFLPAVGYHRVGVAIEFGEHDPAVLARAAAVVREQADAELVVLHIVEGVGADFYGVETAGLESEADRVRMAAMVDHLRGQGLCVQGVLGFGSRRRRNWSGWRRNRASTCWCWGRTATGSSPTWRWGRPSRRCCIG